MLDIFVSRYLLILITVGCFMLADKYFSSNDTIAKVVRLVAKTNSRHIFSSLLLYSESWLDGLDVSS